MYVYIFFLFFLFFFFQAEDGIRDHCVTGVQTCALPISVRARPTVPRDRRARGARLRLQPRLVDGAEPPARHDHGGEPDETEPGGGAARRDAPWRVRDGARGRGRGAPAREAVRGALRAGP